MPNGDICAYASSRAGGNAVVRLPLDRVRHLSLREIAEMWAPEAKLPVSLMLRELQYAVINIPRLERGEGPLTQLVPTEQLPNPDEQVDRDWLIEFCGKQDWTIPSFCRGRVYKESRFAGRPGFAHRIELEEELERRAKVGELSATLAAEAKALHSWCLDTFPRSRPPTPGTIENALREAYRRLRGPQKQTPP